MRESSYQYKKLRDILKKQYGLNKEQVTKIVVLTYKLNREEAIG